MIYIIIAAVLLVFLIIYLIASWIVFLKIFRPKKRTNDMLIKYEVAEKKFNLDWLDIPYENMTIQSRYGYKLNGKLYKTAVETSCYIIDLHGHNSSSISQLKYLKMFQDMGLNVFIPDHRYSGESEGKYLTMGYFEKYDVLSWINVLQSKFPMAKFGIFGESMGAATAIMSTAMDTRIKFLISYCSYSSISALGNALFGKASPICSKVFKLGLNIVAKLYGIDLIDISPQEYIKKVKVPTLLLHSKKDRLIDFSHAKNLVISNPNAEIHYFENSGHARSMCIHPDEFRRTVQNFIANCKF